MPLNLSPTTPTNKTCFAPLHSPMKETTTLTTANAIVKLSDFSLWTSPILRLRWRWCRWRTEADGMHDTKAQTPKRHITTVLREITSKFSEYVAIGGGYVTCDLKEYFSVSKSKFYLRGGWRTWRQRRFPRGIRPRRPMRQTRCAPRAAAGNSLPCRSWSRSSIPLP